MSESIDALQQPGVMHTGLLLWNLARFSGLSCRFANWRYPVGKTKTLNFLFHDTLEDVYSLRRRS